MGRDHILNTLNMRTGLIFLSLFFYCFASFAGTLPNRLTFQRLLENEDLALGEIEAIYQDSTGYMWFGGANGLIRYDGYEFREIRFQLDEEAAKLAGETSKPVKFTSDIFEDRQGRLWIGTRSGIYIYSPTYETLKFVEDDPSQNVRLSVTRVGRIEETSDGQVFACSDDGLMFFNSDTLGYEVIRFNGPEGLVSRRLNAAVVHDDGKIWFGTQSGIEVFDPQKRQFTLHLPYPKDPSNVAANTVRDIIADEAGKFWVATSEGLVFFDPVTLSTQRYLHEADNRFSLAANDVWRLQWDINGALWIATDGGGISIFDTDGRFYNHRNAAGRSNSISSNKVRTLLEDRNGDMWAGNYPEGINYFDRSSAAIISYTQDPTNPSGSLSHKSVLSIQEDKKGNLWLGTDGGGLNHLNRHLDEFTHYTHDPSNPYSISSNAVLTTYIDSTGLVWVGTWGGGMASFDPATQKFTRYPFDDGRVATDSTTTSKRLNSAHVWSIKEDKNQTLWITTHTGGISKLDRDTGVFTHYAPFEGDPKAILGVLGWTTYEDSKGRFWVGTSSSLELMDRDTGEFTHFVPDPEDPTSISNRSVLAIHEDRKGRLWFGTDFGLNLFNEESQTFTAYKKEIGFLDITFRQILEDKEGNLWLSTNNGISIFSPDTLKVKNINRDGGRLIGGFNTESGLISQNSEIIFGGSSGLRIFKPDQLKNNATIPPIVLTDFRIYADSVPVGGPEGLLNKTVNQTDSITLDYTKSMFVFSFAALNFRDSEKNQYLYKLEGFDKNWLDSSGHRSAKYTNLNAGRYVFKVKGSNNDGVWNENPKTITVIQLPPPWQTWWAYTLYALALVALITWFIHAQSRKRKLVEKQNRLLEAKVAERTAALRQKNNDIQAMLSNMPQGLFTVQKGQIIHPEYSAYLQTIFETDEIAGRQACDLLFSGAKAGSDQLSSTEAACDAIIGEDEMNFEFNQHSLLTEYGITINGKDKILSLDWNPIVEEDVVQKLMVSVRDVTELRKMEAEAEHQKRELDIIGQLLNFSSDKYRSFEDSARKYLQENRTLIQANDERDNAVLAQLFRNMHTIKGNCRTYSFSHLANVVHEVESTYNALRDTPDMEWKPLQLLNELSQVEKTLDEYSKVFHGVLGRAESDQGRSEGFWMTDAAMEKIISFLDDNKLDELRKYLKGVHAATLEETIADVVISLGSIASQLDKSNPSVDINAPNLLIRQGAQDLINDLFAHILRNSIDHGIETIEERKQSGKDEQGHIRINAMKVCHVVNMYIRDDGRGLDMDKLYQKGLELGEWTADDKLTCYRVAQLIFRSGVSTKDCVTEISGRGVGMDAVKTFVTTRGGHVDLIFPDLNAEPKGFVPFELVLTLPAEDVLAD